MLGDIHQAHFGDCFLLSALLSILSREGGGAFINSLFRQDGNNVVVTLYDYKDCKPVECQISLSEFYEADKLSVRYKQPWVHALEKALC